MEGQTVALLVIADILMLAVLVSISRGAYRKLKINLDYDELTKLPIKDNFRGMYEKEMASIGQSHYAMIVMDLSGFKLVNEMFGRDEGDRLLIYTAKTLQKCINKNIATRLGDDVFMFGFRYEKKEEIAAIIRDISEELTKYTGKIRPYAYFGICYAETANDKFDDLMDHANLALETIKRNRLKNYAVYSRETRDTIMREKRMENEMMTALEEHQFAVYFQPKYDIETSKVVGAEALVRWNHPQEGFLTPNAFIPLFERDGLIIKLDEYVWEETCIIMREWMDKGYDVVPVSVNVSRIHLFNEKLREKIFEITERYKIPHHLLELEITESAFLENAKDLYKIMDDFRESGFTVSMDDFGSGYSSLNMLKDGNVDIVKIDKEFLNETVASKKGKMVIKSAVNMVKELNMDVIAEGVENQEQADFLLRIGCNTAQGYYYSKPIEGKEFEKKVYMKGDN